MKYLMLVLFSFAMNEECSQKNRDTNVQDTNMVESITYQATTRGYHYECSVDKNNIAVNTSGVNERNSQATMAKEDWGKLEKMVKELDLSGLEHLEAPSSGSYTDRAAMGSLRIVVGGKTYESASFDDGNPPEALRPLIDQITALAETVE